MNVEISNPLKAQKSTEPGPLPFTIDHKLLIKTLQEATNRSIQHKRTILASFTQKIEWHDTIQAFNGAILASLGECFFWEQPAEQTTLIGLGAATSIETIGTTCFIDSAFAWRALMNDAVISYAPETEPTPGSGPVLFGGFAFDALSPRTQLWSEFPDGLLILPHFLLSYNADHVTLTINSIIQATDSIELNAQQIEEDLSKLQIAIKQSSNIPLQHSTTHFSIYESQSASEWTKMVANVVRLHENYPGAYVFAIQRGESFFIGATPERLVLAQDGQIHTMALAGSVRRGETEAEDTQLGAELLQSEKNINEHIIVVAMVQEALKKHCTNVQVSATPQLLKLQNLQHLQTPITGDLIPGRCILDVMAELHPTPAVGGFPREVALEEIRNIEKLDRGWYAGPLGWIGASGHGEFAVALRSGLVNNTKATLFAGCGIVSSSEPQIEYAESWWKFQVMLRGLGDNNQR